MSQEPWKPDNLEDWCLHHEELLAFIRTVAAVISTVAVLIILFKSLT